MPITGDVLAEGQLAATEGDLFTATAVTYVVGIRVCNTNVASNTIKMYFKRATSRQLGTMVLALDESGDWIAEGGRLVLENGDKIRGFATNASQVDYVIFGGVLS
jgi:hypothetical protein